MPAIDRRPGSRVPRDVTEAVFGVSAELVDSQMSDENKTNRIVNLPDDLVKALDDLSERLGESPRDIVIAAVDHFTRIPEQQRKAIMRGTAMRRRG